ncbi:hypothetical protein ACVWYN_003227 [Pedobacter sp. UYP24]
MVNIKLTPSEFKDLKGIEYFKFEEDFIEENVRCIPMIVRFKMDIAGIKLKLAEWSRFYCDERIELALLPIATKVQILNYREYLQNLIAGHTGKPGTELKVESHPDWANLIRIPQTLREKSAELNIRINLAQWQSLTNIQRFALLKLCRPGHENKNFPVAVAEFGLITL